jgi:hypothetical protein
LDDGGANLLCRRVGTDTEGDDNEFGDVEILGLRIFLISCSLK